MRSEGPGALRPETLTVGYGYDPASAHGAAKPPLYLTSTFGYASAQHAKDVHRACFDGDGPEAGAESELQSLPPCLPDVLEEAEPGLA